MYQWRCVRGDIMNEKMITMVKLLMMMRRMMIFSLITMRRILMTMLLLLLLLLAAATGLATVDLCCCCCCRYHYRSRRHHCCCFFFCCHCCYRRPHHHCCWESKPTSLSSTSVATHSHSGPDPDRATWPTSAAVEESPVCSEVVCLAVGACECEIRELKHQAALRAIVLRFSETVSPVLKSGVFHNKPSNFPLIHTVKSQ